MSHIDQAFLKAYMKQPQASAGATTSSVAAPRTSPQSQDAARTPLVQWLDADGDQFIRVESPHSAQPPAPAHRQRETSRPLYFRSSAGARPMPEESGYEDEPTFRADPGSAVGDVEPQGIAPAGSSHRVPPPPLSRRRLSDGAVMPPRTNAAPSTVNRAAVATAPSSPVARVAAENGSTQHGNSAAKGGAAKPTDLRSSSDSIVAAPASPVPSDWSWQVQVVGNASPMTSTIRSTPPIIIHDVVDWNVAAPQPARESTPALPMPVLPTQQRGASNVGRAVASNRMAEARAPIAPAEPLEPAWEIDAVIWPDACDWLSRTMGPGLAEVGRHLAESSRAGLRVLAITSPSPAQGRTTVTLTLARAAAEAGLRVAVVDGDLSHPDLCQSMHLDVSRGWCEALRDDMPLDEVAVYSLRERMTFIPMLSQPSNTSPPTLQVLAMLDRLAQSYDLVLIDAGPIAGVGATLIGTGPVTRIDAAIVIRDMRTPQQHSMQGAAKRLRQLGIENLGVIENFAGPSLGSDRVGDATSRG
jgi:Mrp family chromosome partitioning ATPase